MSSFSSFSSSSSLGPGPGPVPESPQYMGARVSSLCSLLGRPQILTGLFRAVLVQHFSDSGRFIEAPELKQFVWQEDERTNILIESSYRWRPELTEKRPAVMIKRNSCANRKVGIDNRLQGRPANNFGGVSYATYWIGSHTLFCMGATGAQAELLGTEVQRELTEFGPVIRASVQLHQLNVVEVGAVAKLEEAQENFVVPVTVGYAYEERWQLQPQAPLLKTVSLSTLLAM